MDKFTHQQIDKWIKDKLEKDSNKFGSDDCNSLFMQTYTYEHYGVSLPISLYKAISTVSRKKSKILLDNPQWDKRVRDKPKKRKKKEIKK